MMRSKKLFVMLMAYWLSGKLFRFTCWPEELSGSSVLSQSHVKRSFDEHNFFQFLLK